MIGYHPIIGGPDDGREHLIVDSWKFGQGKRGYKLEGKSGLVSEDSLTLIEEQRK
jgi:hypothetical protein